MWGCMRRWSVVGVLPAVDDRRFSSCMEKQPIKTLRHISCGVFVVYISFRRVQLLVCWNTDAAQLREHSAERKCCLTSTLKQIHTFEMELAAGSDLVWCHRPVMMSCIKFHQAKETYCKLNSLNLSPPARSRLMPGALWGAGRRSRGVSVWLKGCDPLNPPGPSKIQRHTVWL